MAARFEGQRFADRCLDMQGFEHMSQAERRRYGQLLRFTPAACTTLVVVGLALGSPAVLAFTAAIALIGALLPSAHPLDVFYNTVLRRAFGGPALPPNPAPRRFAAGIKSFPLFAAAAAIQLGYAPLGLAVGAFLALVGAVAAATNWDLGSWLYRRLTALLRRPRLVLAPVPVAVRRPNDRIVR